MKEKQEADLESIHKMEEQRLQQIEKKKKRDQRRKEEEEVRKREEDKRKRIEEEEKSNAENVATAVSPNPTDNDSMTVEVPNPAINLHLTEMMQGIEDEAEGSKDLESCSPPSNKQKKKASKPLLSSKMTNAPGKKAHTIIDTHAHKFPRTIIDGAIELKDANPFQEFIVALQNLLKN